MSRRPTLLVVDDEPSILALVERFATREGFEMVSVGDGSQTLAWLRPGLADVLLRALRGSPARSTGGPDDR